MVSMMKETLEFKILLDSRWNRYELYISCHSLHYSPFWALASPQKIPPFFSVFCFPHLIPRICDVSFRTTSSNLFLGFPTGFVLWTFPLRTFFGILSSSFLIIWPTHHSLLILISCAIFRTLYKLQILLFHLACIGHKFLIFSVQMYIAFFLSFVFGHAEGRETG